MRCSGSPVTSEYSVRCACGACVVHQTVSFPLTRSNSASAPQVSIGAGCERGKVISCSTTTTSARANTASVAAASPASQSKMWLSIRPGSSSRITGASGLERRAGVDHGRQQLVLDLDQLERVARRVAVVGDHERDLLALEADLVRGQDRLLVGGHRRHPRRTSRSSPVSTAWTFGCCSAAEVSIETIRACATGERSIAPCSVPRRWMSST